MRWTAAAVILGLSLVAAASDDAPSESHAPWDDVPAVKLWEAVKAGDVQASGSQPRSYRQVKIHVANRSGKRTVVDLGGSHLRPKRRGSCQRLGLGPPVVADLTTQREPGSVCVLLEPGEEKSLVLNTCCLDAGLPAPGNHEFVAVPEELPAVREDVLRWWVANPDVPQHAVNSADWRNVEHVVVPGEQATRRLEAYRQAAACGGVSFQLKDEELTSLDADGVRRVLGSQIWRIFPTEEAVYAVMPGEDRLPDLWRLAPTGENPWGFVTDVVSGSELLDVVPAGGGNLALLYADRVDWFDAEQGEATKVITPETDRFLSARVGKRTGKVYVTVHDPRDNGVQRGGMLEGQSAGRFEIWVIDPKRGAAELAERFWNVSAIRGGQAGIFGLSHKGVIRHYAGGRFKDLGPVEAYQAIAAVGRERVWLIDDAGRLVTADPRSGRRLLISVAKIDKEAWLVLDPVTDDLTYATTAGFFRIRAKDGTVEKLPEAEEF